MIQLEFNNLFSLKLMLLHKHFDECEKSSQQRILFG